MKLFTLLLTIICILGLAVYAEGRYSPTEIQKRRLNSVGSKHYFPFAEDDENIDESVGLGFAGSSFRHAVNNQRPEVQRANRNGAINGLKETFKNPSDIPTDFRSGAAKGLELGINMIKNGYGSQGMGNWDENVGGYSPGANQAYWNRL